MSEDLFSQLFDLFNQPGPVNWRLAGEISRHLAGEPEPIEPWLAEEYRDLVRLAQLRLADVEGIEAGSYAVVPLDRRGWADSHLQSYAYVVEPLGTALADSATSGPMGDVMRPLGPALIGLQAGMMVGFASHQVLADFDFALPTAAPQAVSLVVPNVEVFANEHGLDARQLRLWVAFREVIHQSELTRPWVRPKIIELVRSYVDGLEFDPEALAGRIQSFQDPEQFEQLMGDTGGIAGLVSSPEQRPQLEAIQAFMAILDGYAAYLLDRTATRLLPDLERIRGAVDLRGTEPTQGDQMLAGMLGLEIDRARYRQSAAFCHEIDRRWGTEALEKVWDAPANLPTLAELDDPVGWAARVLLPGDL